MKQVINYMKKTGKFTNVWGVNNMLLNNQWVKEEINGKSKNTLRQTKMEIYQDLWHIAKALP